MLEGTVQGGTGSAAAAAAQPEVKARTTCRSCGSRGLAEVLDLGNRYISNFPDVPDAARLPRAPLELLLCSDCSLLQLRHTVPAEWLYRRYWYKSGINAAMCCALADVTRCASVFTGLVSGDSVLDVGCNDGTLLRSYTGRGIRRVGFEPAENLAAEASRGTDCVIPDFFNARWLAGEQFRIITSIAMFYDLEDPNAFVADIKKLLARNGVWVIEMHYLSLTLERNAFDAVCHEHLEYYSLQSLEPLLTRHNLAVADVETNEMNGGSFRIYVVHAGSPAATAPAKQARVEERRAAEKKLALDRPETYQLFGARIREIGAHLSDWLSREASQGKEVYVYGASTKGNTLLQVFGINHLVIRGAAERNPEKWGKYTVGTWIPIVSEEEARAHAHDFLILPWHFLPEICVREHDFVARGGKLVAPLPGPRFINSTGVHALA
jgi:NDP-4-keto-2,6-dideoxyhexose 3-C-methyltransferase